MFVSRRYESAVAQTVHGWLVDLLPPAPALVLDVGAGTGRDAAWLASRGLGSSRAGGREMISPPTRQGINPHGSLLEPLWNLFRETILLLRWPSERKRQVFNELRGGRTRTRTLDPLIKSYVHHFFQVFGLNRTFRLRVFLPYFITIWYGHNMTFGVFSLTIT